MLLSPTLIPFLFGDPLEGTALVGAPGGPGPHREGFFEVRGRGRHPRPPARQVGLELVQVSQEVEGVHHVGVPGRSLVEGEDHQRVGTAVVASSSSSVVSGST